MALDIPSPIPAMGGGMPAPPASPSPSVSPLAAMGGARVGPVTQPTANQGNQVQAMAQVTNALKMLESALPRIPMGTELHTRILDTVKNLGKAIGDMKSDPSMQLQELVRAAREASQGGPQAALSRMFPTQAGGGGGAPALPPAMPARAA